VIYPKGGDDFVEFERGFDVIDLRGVANRNYPWEEFLQEYITSDGTNHHLEYVYITGDRSFTGSLTISGAEDIARGSLLIDGELPWYLEPPAERIDPAVPEDPGRSRPTTWMFRPTPWSRRWTAFPTIGISCAS
jgi:hypothetical protein